MPPAGPPAHTCHTVLLQWDCSITITLPPQFTNVCLWCMAPYQPPHLTLCRLPRLRTYHADKHLFCCFHCLVLHIQPLTAGSSITVGLCHGCQGWRVLQGGSCVPPPHPGRTRATHRTRTRPHTPTHTHGSTALPPTPTLVATTTPLPHALRIYLPHVWFCWFARSPLGPHACPCRWTPTHSPTRHLPPTAPHAAALPHHYYPTPPPLFVGTVRYLPYPRLRCTYA